MRASPPPPPGRSLRCGVKSAVPSHCCSARPNTSCPARMISTTRSRRSLIATPVRSEIDEHTGRRNRRRSREFRFRGSKLKIGGDPMRGPAALSDEHAEAIAGAYELIEIVQGQDDGGRVAVADQAAAGHGWADVRVLLDFARSLAAREAGADDAAHVEKMIERATTLDARALLALAWATSANRRTTTRRSVAGGESALIPLVRAIVLLDAAGGPVVHRAA